jgi:hypothetical protein
MLLATFQRTVQGAAGGPDDGAGLDDASADGMGDVKPEHQGRRRS